MGKLFLLIFILFCLVSYKFLIKFGTNPERELIESLTLFSSVECPAGITLYRLKSGSSLYRIQVQDKLPHDILEKANILRKCERKSELGKRILLQNERYDIGVDKMDAYNDYYNVVNSDTSYLLEEVCDNSEDEIDSVQTTFSSRDITHPIVSNAFFAYMLQVVKGPEPASLSGSKNDTEAWSYQTLVSGIFPGTLWCGFGNMAEDVYGQVGEHADTDNCCRSHDLCKPIIKAFENRYFYSNPSLLPISHCGCDAQFYKCLLRVNSPASKTIGKIFFNLVKMKCFDFDFREVCTSSFLGLCLQSQEKCVAVLKSNKRFPN